MTRHESDRNTKNSTNAGKKRKKKNALTHGVYASDVILPWESRNDFENLHAELCAEFNPTGQSEKLTVFDLAHLYWQKQRIKKTWHAATLEDPFVMELVQSEKKSYSGIRRYLREEAGGTHSLVRSLLDIVSEHAVRLAKVGRTMEKAGYEKADIDAAGSKINAILSALSEHIFPLIKTLQSGPNAERTLGRAYSPEYLEPILRVEATIDARIDKAIRRLAMLKTYKGLVEKVPPRLPSFDDHSGSRLLSPSGESYPYK
jgi:hypothetical protein